MTAHERDVIGGLKQLTESIFKQYFRDEHGLTVSTVKTTSNEPNATPIPLMATSAPHMAKENQTNVGGTILEAAMKGAEEFCAMVVQQLNTNHDEKDDNDDWHNGQLHAYSSASQRLFEPLVDGEQSPATAHDKVRRQLNDF